MITIEKYSSEKCKIWDEFVKKSKNGTFMLMRAYVDYHADRFTDFSLLFFDDGKLLALLPASLHGNEVRSHGGLTYGGILTNTSMKATKMLNCFDVLKEYLIENGITKLVYKKIPYIYEHYPSDEDVYALFRNGAQLYRRDISSTIYLPNIVKLSNGKRGHVVKAQKNGVELSESVDFDSFIELENSVLLAQHQKMAVHTADELRKLQTSFPDNIKLHLAHYQGELVAGILIYIYDTVVHTQYMAASEISREIGALDYLIKNLIDKYQTTKTYFDFGISTEDDGMYLNEGLISQKQEFGARGVLYDFYAWEIQP
ncbi:MAG: GNAT family N-acetyltransferase [Paludibacter sp.]|nr:GNAT family N-acetyltransferase [Paludibacter sp.]